MIAIREVCNCCDKIRESLRRQTATADVLKVISRSTFDLSAVLNTLVKSAARLCEADMASVPRLTGTIFQIKFRAAAILLISMSLCEEIRSFPGAVPRPDTL